MDRFKEFTGAIIKISRMIFQIKSNEMKDYDLNSISVACLYYLYNYENLTSKDLVNLCCEDKASISRNLKILEERMLVEFLSNDDKKRYKTVIVLTEEGKDLAKIVTKKCYDIFRICSNGILENEAKILYKSLDIIVKNLEEYKKKYEE